MEKRKLYFCITQKVYNYYDCDHWKYVYSLYKKRKKGSFIENIISIVICKYVSLSRGTVVIDRRNVS